MMRPDEADDPTPSDPTLAASRVPTGLLKTQENQANIEPTPRQGHSDGTVSKRISASPAARSRKSRKNGGLTDSRCSSGMHGKGTYPGGSTRIIKRGTRGHSTRQARVLGAKAESSREPAVRQPVECELSKTTPADPNEASEEGQTSQTLEEVPTPMPLEPRRSTYFSICLNASPDELTVISYNVRMESSCCPFDDNCRMREAALSRYLLSLEDSHHPDVLLIQGAFSNSTLRLLKRFVREDPMFPFQTRVVGGDPGCCKTGNDEGGCSCSGSCWCCLPSASRKIANKGSTTSFVEKNGWDSVSGNFLRFRGHGGIVVMSKWPILRRHAYIFASSAYPQSLCNAGAALVQVEKCGKVYNVLTMQLQPGVNNNEIRLAQVKEVMAWVRTGMEDSEKIEFASCDIDGSFISPTDTSTRSEGSVTGSDMPRLPEHPGADGLPKFDETQKGESVRRAQDHIPHGYCAELPKGVLKATDPLIIGGNLNFRFSKDRASLIEALGPDGFRAALAIEDESIAHPSFDTVNNDTCYYRQGRPQQPTQELLDYLLIYSDSAGRVARGQRTLVDPAPDKILYRPVVLGCMPCSTTQVSHVSDFFPVCATFAHTRGS